MIKAIWTKYKYQILLIAAIALLFITNYKPGTYLIGWDNLQTDLNPTLGVKRAIFSVWEEYQSFGLVAGMGHAADLVRAIYVWLISLVLPQSLIRYFYLFSMLAVGAIGMFKLLTYTAFDGGRRIYAFLGSLFYLLNIGVLQLMYLPFEPFVHFFAFLPIEIWIFLKILRDGFTRRLLILFFIINILATPQAYIQTLFLVYGLLLAIFTLSAWLKQRTLKLARRATLLFLILCAINAFWLLPQIYFLKTSASVVTSAKVNQISTADFYYQNLEKGNIHDFFTMRGFYFDLFGSRNLRLFDEWHRHFATQGVNILPYVFAAIIIAGFFYKSRHRGAFIGGYILCAFILLNGTPVLKQANELIRSIGLINQIFRSEFTKLIIPYALFSSYFFASGIALIVEKFKVRKHIVAGIFLVLIFIYAYPAFRGSYISSEMRVKVPNEYLETIEYFKHQDKNKRIGLLPEYTFWGWYFTRWGYNGSGFIWYGIEQPIVSRTFDTWSNVGESYSWELKTAIESENTDKFYDVISKYNIDYFILDKSYLPVSSSFKGIQYDSLNHMLMHTLGVKKIKDGKFITLYSVTRRKEKSKSFIAAARNLKNIGPSASIMNQDDAHLENGMYQTTADKPYDAYYPFIDLTSYTHLYNSKWQFSESAASFNIKTLLPFETSTSSFSGIKTREKNKIYTDNRLKEYDGQFQITASGKYLVTEVKKTLITKIDLTGTDVGNCNPDHNLENIQTEKKDGSITVKARGQAIACFTYDIPYLEQRDGYLLKIKSKNIQGRKPYMYILDKTKEQSYLEDRLLNSANYFFITPRYKYGRGYSIVFQYDSYKNLPSINTIESVEIYTFPYESIRNIHFLKNTNEYGKTLFSQAFEAKKINYYTYVVRNFPSVTNSYVILNQSYHKGWIAYIIKKDSFMSRYLPFLFGRKVTNHVLINNWANGWELPANTHNQNTNLILIFWPQYLEYTGFWLLGVALVFFLLKKNDR